MAATVVVGDVNAKVNGTESMASNGEPMVKDNGMCENGTKAVEEPNNVSKVEEDKVATKPEDEAKMEEVPVEVEPKTRFSFPVKLEDGKQLDCVGLRKKSMLGMGIKIYAFGMISLKF